MEGKATEQGTYSLLASEQTAAAAPVARASGMSRAGGPELAEMEIQSVPLIARALSCLCCPLVFGNSCFTLQSRTEAAVFHMGVLTGIESTPGLHWIIPFGGSVKRVATTNRTVVLPELKVADKQGNPVVVSTILNYRVVDAKKAILNVQNVDSYIQTNSQAVLKQVVSQYTYDQLKTDTEGVNGQLQQAMQLLVDVAGVRIERMALNDLSYAPEVAASMLKKQQAYALIEARTLIVRGAVEIAKDAVRLLEADGDGAQGLTLTTDQKVKIVTNLLTVTCAENNATPTVGM